MKTKEFVEKVDMLGFNASERGEEKIVVLFGVREVATVSTCEMYAMNTSWWTFYDLDLPVRRKLFELLVEYAETPIQDREEEKRYYLKFPQELFGEGESYLNLEISSGTIFSSDNYDVTGDYMITFTDSDIAKLPERYRQGVGCEFIEKVEVE